MYKSTNYNQYTNTGYTYKPQTIITTQKHSDHNSVSTNTTRISYNAMTGLQTWVKENYNTEKEKTTTNTYDTWGNLLSSTLSSSDTDSLTTNYVYNSTKRFVAQKYTTPASTITNYAYDTWGNVWSQTDATDPENLQTTSYTYDNFGNLKSTQYPDGTRKTRSMGWNNNGMKRYYILERGTKQPWVKTWYDNQGREVMVETIGAKEVATQKITTYNNKGQADHTETTSGNFSTSTDYTYDARGRLLTQTDNLGRTLSYGYGYRTDTTTINVKVYIKTYDAWGNTLTSSDPVSSVSYAYHSNGKPKQATVEGAVFTMQYDAVGNQIALIDPNAGTISYAYDAEGKPLSQTNGNGKVTTNSYDNLRRLTSRVTDGVTTNYTYGTTGNSKQRLVSETMGGNTISYTYDNHGRVLTESHQLGTTTPYLFTNGYTDGQLTQITYPDGVIVNRQYDAYGNLIKVLAKGSATGIQQTLWELTGETGTVTTTKLGNTLTATETHNTQGLLTELKTVNGNTVIHDMDFVFNAITGNLTSRSGMTTSTENFVYDDIDRLTAWQGNEIAYGDNGNITHKWDIGDYEYNPNNKPHALRAVDNDNNLISLKRQDITYTAFDKVSVLTDTVGNDAYRLEVTYGPDLQRWKTVLKKNDAVTRTTIYMGDYEVVTENGTTKQLHYISGASGLAAIYVKQSGQSDQVYYVHKDHLGSIVKLTTANGTEYFKAHYDAWGKRTVTTNTFKFNRGYTGHEQWDEIKLIDMNGRMYDPILGRFLSPDPFVQMPDFSQNFNRYSYALNNPLKYTDPSGEFIFTIFNAVKDLFVNIYNTFANGFDAAWDWHSTEMAWKIDMGAFKGNFGQIVSRFTWELFQTVPGYYYSHISNVFNGVKSVSYYGGATAVESYSSDWGAITLGSYINGQRGLQAEPDNSLFQHEYGHYLQSQAWGPAYFTKVGVPSLVDTFWGGNHDYHPIELDANVRAFKYFSTHEKDFNSTVKSSYEMEIWDSKWHFEENPIPGYNETAHFNSWGNQYALRSNLTHSLNVFDLTVAPIAGGLLYDWYYNDIKR
jgi:RHS repeat-associated protein